jgi:hypothetical protein
MEQYDHLYVECKNEECRQPIWLHRSSPLGTSSGPPETPADALPKIWLCPACGHAFDYSKSEHRHSSFPHPDPYQQGRLIVGTVEFYCEAERCGVLVQIHKPMDAETAHERWHETANATARTRALPERTRHNQGSERFHDGHSRVAWTAVPQLIWAVSVFRCMSSPQEYD